MSIIASSPGDFIVGKVLNYYGNNDYYIEVSHIGLKNKVWYKDWETVKIQNKLPNKLTGKKLIGSDIKCIIQYRDEYNRLLCTVEECAIETKTIIKIKIKTPKPKHQTT